MVSSAENAPSEQVLMNEVAGAVAISRDRDANRGNSIVRSNGLADGHIPVATQATLSTQTTTTIPKVTMCVVVCNTVHFSAPHRCGSNRCNGTIITHFACGVYD